MKCKKCGAVMFVNNNIVLTSNPSQYQLYCPECGHIEYEYYEEIKLQDLGVHIACPECEQKDQQIAELKKELVQSRENLTQCEADRRFEQEKKNIAMKRVSELKKQLALAEKQCVLMAQHIREYLRCDNTEDEIYEYFRNQAVEELKNEENS